MSFTRALLRRPGPDFAAGLTMSRLGVPEYQLMLKQHASYAAALAKAGLQLEVLEPLPGYPDAYFVEDVAVVFPELAIVTRPGADERRGEAEHIGDALGRHRPLARLVAPATLDGGDVLVVGKTVFIGLSARTNSSGAAQMAQLLSPHGYRVKTVPVEAGLHFKSSVSWLWGTTLLVTGPFAGRPELRDHQLIEIDAAEEYACNTLSVNGTLITPAGFPRTLEKLARLQLPIIEVDASEPRKMDGGLTCMSLRY